MTVEDFFARQSAFDGPARVYLGAVDFRPAVAFFEGGGQLKLREEASADEWLAELQRVPGLMGSLQPLGAQPDDPAPVRVAAGEFVLEGLWAQKKIGRTDDRGFVAVERPAETDIDLERLERLRRMKKQVN